jgi:hypothetical protein
MYQTIKTDWRRSWVRLVAPATILLLAACAAVPEKKPVAAKPAADANPAARAAPADYVRPCAAPGLSAHECDRRSILAMAGEYRVRFAFDEIAALAPGYAPHAAQRSAGSELVVVIADSADHISLQHILVLGEKHTVVKHWRQDWDYQPLGLLQFRGNGVFAWRQLSPTEANGRWSQTVYEVDEAPRYAGIGRWQHDNGIDAWESDRVWRPLPRREYTKRKDYQALEVVNRHTLTPDGWIHEQDNTKLVLHADGSAQALARESGVNSYTHLTGYDFAAGRAYWKGTQAYWADVRGAWLRAEGSSGHFTTSPEPDGEARIDELFKLAENADKGEMVSPTAIDTLLTKYVHSP